MILFIRKLFALVSKNKCSLLTFLQCCNCNLFTVVYNSLSALRNVVTADPKLI